MDYLDVLIWIAIGGFMFLFVWFFAWWIRRSIRGNAPRNTDGGGASDAAVMGSFTSHGGHHL